MNERSKLMSDTPQRLAIIPARGASKGIHRKNLETVAARPLIVRAIDAVRRAGISAVVTTDDPEIAAVARDAEAIVIERPHELATDDASTESAVLHALAELDVVPHAIAIVQCTSPFVSADDVDRTLAAVETGAADTAFTATPFHGFIWQMESGSAVGINHDHPVRLRRQDRPAEFLETGAAYAMNTVGFMTHRHRFFGRVLPIVVHRSRAIEIDDVEDLDLAEAMAQRASVDTFAASVPPDLQAIAFDFDGVLTDNGVYVSESGIESVRFDRSDGLAMERLRSAGLRLVVISKEKNPVVAVRCEKLGLEVYQGVDDKAALFRSWLSRNSIETKHVAFVGNDVNDVECLRLAGIGIAVGDARPAAHRAADFSLATPGGRGAVSELADLVLEARKESI